MNLPTVDRFDHWRNLNRCHQQLTLDSNAANLLVVNSVSLAFVKASGNLALRQPAFDSSDYPCFNAKYAVDGIKIFMSCQIAHTNNDVNPWWAVDLGSATNVVNVTITPRPTFGKQ